MKYFEVKFTIDAPEELHQAACDILMAQAGEAGFECFEETEGGFTGYVQQSQFDEDKLCSMIGQLPFGGISVKYDCREAEDRDWNEQWEQEGFEPIMVANDFVIHDGRHIAPLTLSDYSHSVEIDARLAFGTGNHETTRLMIGMLMSLRLEGCRVLDCGCGTGILGIAALKLGAVSATGYDIDEWSVDNARHNAVINGVDRQFTSLHGDASILTSINGEFDVVMANINRNILLSDMPSFVGKLSDNGKLLLSGFYDSDQQMLTDRACSLGLQPSGIHTEGQWACLVFKK